MAKAKVDWEPVDGPARLRPQHSLDRDISPVAGAPKAFRKVSPLDRSFEAGQITERQHEIGLRYSENFEQSNYTGINLLDPGRVKGSGGSIALPQKRLDARKWLTLVERSLGPNDIAILRLVLGEWWFPSDAIAKICGEKYRKMGVVCRFREAMEALEDAYALMRT